MAMEQEQQQAELEFVDRSEETQFLSNAVFISEPSRALLELAAKTADPKLIQRLKKNAGNFNTDLRRLYLAIETRINWLFKYSPDAKDIRWDRPDQTMMVDLDTMQIRPRNERHLGVLNDSWLVRWSEASVTAAIGAGRTRRLQLRTVAELFEHLYSRDFFLLTSPEDVDGVTIKELGRLITRLSNPMTNINEDANYFNLAPSVLQRIVHSRAGMMFKTNLMDTLKDREIELLQIILNYIDRGVSPCWAPKIWMQMLYRGERKLENLRWSHFRRDHIDRLLPKLEKTFGIKIEVVEKRPSPRRVTGVYIKVTEQPNASGIPLILRERSLLSLDNSSVVIDLPTTDYKREAAEAAPPASKPTKVPRAEFDPSFITQADIDELFSFCDDIDVLEEADRKRFLDTATRDFAAHVEGKVKTRRQWARQWINYGKRSWRLRAEDFLLVPARKALTDALINREVASLANSLGVAEGLVLEFVLEELELFIQFNVGKSFSVDKWATLFQQWLQQARSLSALKQQGAR